jgi:ferric-dicitrate binding protein FerR (iron transport regulator)
MTSSEKLEQAADWFDRFDDLAQSEHTEFSQWLSEADNNKAFTRIANAMGQPEIVAAAATLSNKLLTQTPKNGAKSTSASSQVLPLAPQLHHRVNRRLFWRRGYQLSFAASFVGVAVLLAYVLMSHRHGMPSDTDVNQTAAIKKQAVELSVNISTGIAEHESQVLADGSVIYLNSDSELAVAHTAALRNVALHKGQAYFDVAKDPARPFIVDVGNASVQVVGTSFDIDRLSHATTIRVYDGIVKVLADKMITLTRGEGVILHDGIWQKTFRLAQLQLPEWRSGWLTVDNMPLSEVVERLSRYLTKPVIVQGEDDIAVTGRFKLSEPKQSLALLASSESMALTENTQTFVLHAIPQ